MLFALALVAAAYVTGGLTFIAYLVLRFRCYDLAVLAALVDWPKRLVTEIKEARGERRLRAALKGR